jgi:hypothetical protein
LSYGQISVRIPVHIAVHIPVHIPVHIAVQIAVIPAKAGIHFDVRAKSQWIPAFAGMTVLPTVPHATDHFLSGPSAIICL